MRKRYMKGISLALAVALTVAFLNSDVVTTVNEQDPAVVETESKETTQADSVTESAATEQVVDQEQTMQEIASAQTITSEEVSNETEDTVTGEVEDVKPETSTSGLADNAVTASDMQQIDLEDKVGVAANDAITKFIKDTNLCTAVMKAYNATATKQVDSANDLTYAMLKGVTLDISAYPEAASVTTLEGLGQLQNVKSMDLSGCTKVTEILANEFGKCTFTSIELPSSITRIGRNAFKECVNLKSIVFPDSLQSIDEYAFNGCKALEKIASQKKDLLIEDALPSALEFIGQHAFSQDSALKKIIITELSNGNAMASSVFAQCTQLNSVEIGSTITQIPANCFTNAGTESETGIEIKISQHSKLKKILSSAFSGINLNETNKTVDLGECNELEAIADSAFEDATNLDTIILPIDTKKMEFGAKAFAKTEVTQLHVKGLDEDGVVVPDYVTEFGDACFYGNTKMQRFVFPNNADMKKIPTGLLDGCSSLSEIVVKDKIGVESIGDCAFRGTAIEDTEFLMNMKSLKIVGEQTIMGGAKSENYGVYIDYNEKVSSKDTERVEQKMKVKQFVAGEYKKADANISYGSEVFTNCEKLKNVHIPATVEQIGARAFYFPIGISQVEQIVWETSSSAAERTIGVGAFQGNRVMTSVKLPDNKEDKLEIGAYAFAGDIKMSRIGGKTNGVLPSSTWKLGEGAFYWCMAIPSIEVLSTTSGNELQFGDKVFERCSTMTKAVIPKETVEIPRHFFYDVPLKTFYIKDELYTDTTPNSISKIGDLAFFANQFTVIDLSNYTSLEEIGAGAFAYNDYIVEDKYETTKEEVALQSKGQPLLNKVILPSVVSDTLFINSAPFAGQKSFNTMYRAGTPIEDKVISIPDYMIPDEQQGLFASTGVQTVKWQADITGKNQWTTINPAMYWNCEEIKDGDVKNVLPGLGKCDYLKSIGKTAFYESNVTKVDLSGYTKLTEIGAGQLSLSSATIESHPGVFEECMVETIILPNTDEKLEIGEKTFFDNNASEVTVELGTTSLIGTSAFQNCAGLKSIVFPDTLIKIDTNSFNGCANLIEVEFGKIEEISGNAFANCTSLVLSDNHNLPDTLKIIGVRAFQGASNLGGAYFGENLKTISNYAFYKSGLSSVEFHSPVLSKIGEYAFNNTQIKEFNLQNTAVKKIEKNTLADCPILENVSFGEEVESVVANALSGNPNFKSMVFYSTTTLASDIFYSKGVETGAYTAENNKNKITFKTNTPEETVIAPVGREVVLPYYVSAYNEDADTPYNYILLNEGATTDQGKECIQIIAKTVDGYYWGINSDSDNYAHKIDDESYIINQNATYMRTYADKSTGSISAVKIKGLKNTDEPLDIKVVCTPTFTRDDQSKIIVDKYEADYQVVVKDAQFYSNVYTDAACQKEWNYEDKEEWQIQSATLFKQLFFKIAPADGNPVDLKPNTNEVVVETSDADILYPALNQNGTKEQLADNKSITVTYNDNANNAKGIFYIKAVGKGTATIMVYPKENKSCARTYTYNVDSDVSTLRLVNVPTEYQNGMSMNQSFNLFGGMKTFLMNDEITDISQWGDYTNWSISFRVTNESLASMVVIDNNTGILTVVKQDSRDKTIMVQAMATSPSGEKKKVANINIKIKGTGVTSETPNNNQPSSGNNSTTNNNPSNNNNQSGSNTSQTTVRTGQTVEDAASGTTAEVSKVAENGVGGEVTITQITNVNVTKVTIPTTVVVNGVSYQVTAISDNLFAGFKKLSTVILPANVTKIGNGAFQNCKKLKKIVIPKGVKSIGANAFAGCKNLKLITVKTTTLKSVGSNAFKGIHKKAKIKVPKKQYKAYKKLLSNKGQKKSVKIKK